MGSISNIEEVAFKYSNSSTKKVTMIKLICVLVCMLHVPFVTFGQKSKIFLSNTTPYVLENLVFINDTIGKLTPNQKVEMSNLYDVGEIIANQSFIALHASIDSIKTIDKHCDLSLNGRYCYAIYVPYMEKAIFPIKYKILEDCPDKPIMLFLGNIMVSK